jgi:hypothetical protein
MTTTVETATDLPVVSESPMKEVSTLSEVMARFELVSLVAEDGVEPFMIVTPKTFAEKIVQDVDLRELGTSSPSPFTSFLRAEYNRDLQGIKGLQKYDQMRRSDGTVRGTLRLVKTPVLAARWFMEPGGDRLKDRKIAEFVWQCFTEHMTISLGEQDGRGPYAYGPQEARSATPDGCQGMVLRR